VSAKKDAVERKITNRVRMAVRWHMLTDRKEIPQFVLDDPKIRPLIDDEEFLQEVLPLVLTELACLVVEANKADHPKQRLAELQQTYGDELVTLVVKVVNEQDWS
jgi:hypothetical protein